MTAHCRIGRVKIKGGADVRLLPSANIEPFPGLETRLEIPPERSLFAALRADLAVVAIAGRDKFGRLYVATSGTPADTIALFAQGQATAIEYADDAEPVVHGDAA